MIFWGTFTPGRAAPRPAHGPTRGYHLKPILGFEFESPHVDYHLNSGVAVEVTRLQLIDSLNYST